ncbi:MAG: FliM/FliN family flagellar motor switch protein [Proteobacteria bacterium]|nr:FliM/FliN family flagellar motor switch protein [Pseudomonadota bacterium]
MADEDSDELGLDDLSAQLEPEPPGPGPGEAPSSGETADNGAALSVSPVDDRRKALYDVSIDVVAILGTAELQVSQILKLGRGAVVELERMIGEPVELRANNRLVAFGEVVVIEDRLAVKLTDIARSDVHRE